MAHKQVILTCLTNHVTWVDMIPINFVSFLSNIVRSLPKFSPLFKIQKISNVFFDKKPS